MKNISLEYIMNHKFQKTGLEKPYYEKPETSGRFAPEKLKTLPGSDTAKMQELKIKLDRIIYDKNISNSSFESRTNIKMNTIRKSINSPSGRRIPRITIAKFVIGLKLSIDEANELFALESYPLLPEMVLLDAVVVHCLQNHYDIDEFFETCDQVALDIKAVE